MSAKPAVIGLIADRIRKADAHLMLHGSPPPWAKLQAEGQMCEAERLTAAAAEDAVASPPTQYTAEALPPLSG